MLLPYLHHVPSLAAPARLAPSCAVVGRVAAGPGLTLAAYATLRADGEAIRIGANAFFAERATVHIVDGLLAARIGSDVTIGRYALVHACTVEDGVVVGDAAVVMDGAFIGRGALIAPGAMVPPRKKLEGGWLYDGGPAAPVRRVDTDELAAAAAAIRGRGTAASGAVDLPPLDMAPFLPQGAGAGVLHAVAGRAPRIARAYVAPTAVIVGDVVIAEGAGVYFGCAVAAGDGHIRIGERSNVQDNSLLATDATRGELSIGDDVTIGHNVRIGSAVIDSEALIGMGSQLGDGVVVERSACVAARARVEPGTVVRAGWVWAGRPARAFRELKSAEREAFARAAEVYVGYGIAYRGERS